MWDDLKLSGESTSASHTRVVSFRVNRFKKNCMSLLAAISEEDPPREIDPHVLFLMLDGFRDNLGAQAANVFVDVGDGSQRPTPMGKAVRKMALVYGEDKLRGRLGKVRGSLKLSEVSLRTKN